MLPTVIATYGGPYVDAFAVQNPETQMAASKANRLMEDAAQMSRTAIRAMVTFATDDGSSEPVVVTHWSVWGSGNAQKPIVTRSAAGKYTITYASSFTDALDVEETLAFTQASPSLDASVLGAGIYIKAVTSHAVEVWICDDSNTLSDLTAGTSRATVWIR